MTKDEREGLLQQSNLGRAILQKEAKETRDASGKAKTASARAKAMRTEGGGVLGRVPKKPTFADRVMDAHDAAKQNETDALLEMTNLGRATLKSREK